MQERNVSLFATADKIDGIQQILKAWKFHVSRNCYMFQHLTSVIEDAGENLNDKSILQNTTTKHLTNLIDCICQI